VNGFISADGGRQFKSALRYKRFHKGPFLIMEFSVYGLYSEKYDKHYYGYTSNLSARLISHNELGHGWTARYRPWKLIYKKDFGTKAEAMAHEKWLKSGNGRAFIKTLPH